MRHEVNGQLVLYVERILAEKGWRSYIYASNAQELDLQTELDLFRNNHCDRIPCQWRGGVTLFCFMKLERCEQTVCSNCYQKVMELEWHFRAERDTQLLVGQLGLFIIISLRHASLAPKMAIIRIFVYLSVLTRSICWSATYYHIDMESIVFRHSMNRCPQIYKLRAPITCIQIAQLKVLRQVHEVLPNCAVWLVDSVGCVFHRPYREAAEWNRKPNRVNTRKFYGYLDSRQLSGHHAC
jgi:hypothetical protein